MYKTININKKAAAGAALVALSGFVPQPFVPQAQAATTTINVSGEFITGVQLAVGVPANMGKVLATAATGTWQMAAAGTIDVSNGCVALALPAPIEGTINATFVNSAKAVDITVAGFTAAKALGGAGAQGSITFQKLLLADALTATITKVAGTTGTGTAIPASTAADTIKVGARITWSGGQPIGTFALPVTLTIAY